VSTRTFGFARQKAIGQAGEARFLAHYQDIHRLDGRGGDFVGNSGRLIELKTDSYTTEATPNFFMERWSDVEKQKPGGPFQAKEKGLYYFVYTYASGEAYWFHVKELVRFLNRTADDYQYREIMNRAWRGGGYLVPRDRLSHLVVKLDILPAREPKK
jgi:hypothetical protein